MAVLLGSVKKEFTLTELKTANPMFFDKKMIKFLRIYRSDFMYSPKLKSQILFEARKTIEGNPLYTVRKVNKNALILESKLFNNIEKVNKYIGINLKK